MASFELRSNICDGHIKLLAQTIMLASCTSSDLLLEFATTKVKLSAKSDISLVKFVFMADFFAAYSCDGLRRCYIHTKALLGVAKFMLRLCGRERSTQNTIVRCTVEDEVMNRITITVGLGRGYTNLIYRINTNHLNRHQMRVMNAVNRTVEIWTIEVSPKNDANHHFLATDLNECPCVMDQLTVRCSPSEIRYTASASPLSEYYGASTEFVHERTCYSSYSIREPLNITLPFKALKRFIQQIEQNKIPLKPTFTFEGFGMPAHFVYHNPLFKAQHISSTSLDYVADAFDYEKIFNASKFCSEKLPEYETKPTYDCYAQFDGLDQTEPEEPSFIARMAIEQMLTRLGGEVGGEASDRKQDELCSEEVVYAYDDMYLANLPASETNQLGDTSDIVLHVEEREDASKNSPEPAGTVIPINLGVVPDVEDSRSNSEIIELDYSTGSDFSF